MFLSFYQPTLEDIYRIQVVVDGENCRIDALDTSGQQYPIVLQQYLRQADGYVCVFSFNDMALFEAMNYYMDNIKLINDRPIVLVANKLDLPAKEWKVSRKLINAQADFFNNPCIEPTARTREGIERAMFHVVREIRAKKLKKIEKKEDNCCTIL